MLEAITDVNINYHTVMVDDGKFEVYLEDLLKKVTKSTNQTVFRVYDKDGIERAEELLYLYPQDSLQWLFIVDYSKIKRYRARLLKVVKTNSITSKFLIKFDKYVDFKNFNESTKNVNSMYLKRLNMADMKFLLRKNPLSKDLFMYVYYSYRTVPDKVLQLAEALELGQVIRKRKDVTELLGTSPSSAQDLVFKLLSKRPKNAKSRRTVISNRCKVLSELSEVHGFSTLRNILMATVKDFIDIKVIYLNADSYKTLVVPQGYDAKRLLRHKVFYKKILELDLGMLTQLYLTLYNCGVWNDELAMYNFLYNYYDLIGLEVL